MEDFPAGITYQYSYDVSKFLDASIEQVTHTIRDAFILVALVVFLFLGDWRATLIPILAVPVSLIGAFFIIRGFGMSINLKKKPFGRVSDQPFIPLINESRSPTSLIFRFAIPGPEN